MELDRVAVVMRQRTPWEAIDLGHLMARHWWRQVFIIWAVPAGLTLALCSALMPQQLWLPPLLVWWLKPLWDRGAIYVASRRLFGESVALPETFRRLPGLYGRDLLASLTWRRLSLTRSFDLPVTLLEGLKGQARSARLAVLHPQTAGAATALTLVCAHIESFFVLASYALLYMFIPREWDPGLARFSEWVGEAQLLSNALVFITFCLVGPFYAVAGFALYISRRVELEAWDVELRFRQLAARAQPRTSAGPVLVLLLGLTLAGAWPVTPAHAAGAGAVTQTEPAELSASQLEVVEILSQPPFRRLERESGWRLKPTEPDKEPPFWLPYLERFFKTLASWHETLSEVLRSPLQLLIYLLWAGFAAGLVWFLVRYRRAIQAVLVGQPKPRAVPAPATLFGLDVTRESLPADIPASVREHWRRGEARQAVSLLYRALLSRLLHERGLGFRDGHTEGECLGIIQASGDATITTYAGQLTRLWQDLAYGHRLPSEADIEALCRGWDGVFQHAD